MIFANIQKFQIVSRIIKSIRDYFLVIAGLAIIVHLVIPHDHHISGTVSGQKDNCPVSGEKPDHHHGFPLHCHAFNDLAAEKFSPPILKKSFQYNFFCILWVQSNTLTELLLSHTISPESGKPLQDIHLPGFAPLRAPPQVI